MADFEIGLDPNSDIGPIAYVDVTDIKSELENLVNNGREIVQDIQNFGNGLLIA